MKRHVNIPIFIPHLGCPNQCVFCNQRYISGVKEFDISTVRKTIDTVLCTVSSDTECEVAFFGGSFTGIDRTLMINLLEIAKDYLDHGLVSSVRCSTRPDYIDEDILRILKAYGVETIELGLQSSSDAVLYQCKRGHTLSDEKKACEAIKSHGFNLIGQMMIGLPSSSVYEEIETARFIASVGADGARIYPTVVFKDTPLASMTDKGNYVPLSEEEAIARSASVLKVFLEAGIPVIRIGLCESENLSADKTYKAGPNSPSLGEKIISRVYLDNIINHIRINNLNYESIKITVAKGCISKVIGYKRSNTLALKSELGIKSVKAIESDKLNGFNFIIEQERTKECI